MKEIPSGRFAVTTHRGCPNPQVWRQLWDWVQNSGYRWRKSHALERVHDPLGQEAELVFDLYLPMEDWKTSPNKSPQKRRKCVARDARWRTVVGLWLLAATLLPTLGSTMDDVVATEMKKHGIVGVSFAIIVDGEICTAKGYGFTDRGAATRVMTNTLFQAGSVSKPVAALAALRLVEEGRLSLDEDVNRSLKQWQVPENKLTKDEKVTLRRILNHSAGLTVHGFPGYRADVRLPTLTQILDGSKPANTAAIRVDVVPGSRWRYSGGGYTVMQQMLTEVTGKAFPELMKEAVLGPLGMTASTYEQPLPTDRVRLAATGYYPNGKEVRGKWHVYPEMAAAGLWTTPSDLARFAIGIQEALAAKSNPVISCSMTRQMLTVQKGNSGLGLFLNGRGKKLRFEHGGRDEGFDTLLVADAESGHGVIIMINANDNSGAVNRMIEAVREEYHWPEGL
jgi:CubicO group peptidase (beta-lactamase class C family)